MIATKPTILTALRAGGDVTVPKERKKERKREKKKGRTKALIRSKKVLGSLRRDLVEGLKIDVVLHGNYVQEMILKMRE